MKTLIQAIKTKKIFIFLTALATILGFVYFHSQPKPTEKPPEKPPVIKKPLLPLPWVPTQPTQAIFDLNQIETSLDLLPSEAKVYRLKPQEFRLSSAQKIAQKLGFKTPPKILKDPQGIPSYHWSEKEKILSIETRPPKISYSLNLLEAPPLTQGEVPQEKTAFAVAQKFLAHHALLPLPEMKLTISQIGYERLKGPRFVKVRKPTEANLLRLDLEYQLDQKKFSSFNPFSSLISFRIGPDLKVLKFESQLPIKIIEVLGNYPLKTKKEILRELQTHPYLSFFEKEISWEESPKASDFKLIRLNKVEVVYLQPSQNEVYLQPFFSFSGQGQLKSGPWKKVFLYLPAVASSYLRD